MTQDNKRLAVQRVTQSLTRRRSSREGALSRLEEGERAEIASGQATLREVLRRRSEEGLKRPAYRCAACHDRGHLHGFSRPIRPGIDIPYLAAIAGVPVDEVRWCTCEKGAEQREGYTWMAGQRSAYLVERTFVQSGIPPRLRGLSMGSLTGDLARDKELAFVAARLVMVEGRLVPDEIARVHAMFRAQLAGVPRSAEPRYGLLLYGDNGVGKSAVAAVLAEDQVRRGIATLFINYTEFIKRIQAEYGRRDEHGFPCGDAEKVIAQAVDVPFLVIDDLGSVSTNGGTSEDRREIVFRVIDRRHAGQRWTVVTTNLNEAQMEAQFTKRTWQRLKELCLVVRMGGLNLREQTIPAVGATRGPALP